MPEMTAAVKSELEALKETIVGTVAVEQIWLFGSYAGGTPVSGSDLDLYVVLKDDVETREFDAELKILSAIGRAKTMPVDIIANKESQYLRLAEGPTMERKNTQKGSEFMIDAEFVEDKLPAEFDRR